MSDAQLRKRDMDELIAMEREIEPTKNEAIARQAIQIAARWLRKADNQAKMLAQYQKGEAVPVVHGRWVKQNPLVDTEECSHCGYNIVSAELETPFCPWCGAAMKMEGAEE